MKLTLQRPNLGEAAVGALAQSICTFGLKELSRGLGRKGEAPKPSRITFHDADTAVVHS